MSDNKQAVFDAFWKAMDKPAGYTKKSGFLKAGVRDTVVRGKTGVAYLLWGHNIAEFGDGVLTLCDCGYKTPTTKDRINAVLNNNPKLRNFGIQQNRGVWYLTYTIWSSKAMKYTTYRRFKWHSGAKIDLENPFKHLVEISFEALNKKANDEAKRVKSFLNEMKRRIEEGTLAMGGSECWGITMGMQECHECEFLARTNCGGGIRLIEKALKEKGYRYPTMFIAKSNGDGTGSGSCEQMLKHWEFIKTALRTYIKKRLAQQDYHIKAKREEQDDGDGTIKIKRATFKDDGSVVVDKIELKRE